MASDLPPEAMTKSALDKMLNDFEGFEGQLRNGTRQRREKDEFRVSELRSTIKEVESEVGEDNILEAQIERADRLNTPYTNEVVDPEPINTNLL